MSEIRNCETCVFGSLGIGKNNICGDCTFDPKDGPTNWESKESAQPAPEAVDHPSHYNREGSMECIEEMLIASSLEEVLAFCKLNVWKYRYRAGDKNGAEDMKKSDWYMRKYAELKQQLNTAPKAHSDTIIRCKDCKYCEYSGPHLYCKWRSDILNPDGFCDNAERKSE